MRPMDEHAKHQLRLQQMVERMSIAVVTYYGVDLVGYVAVSLPIPMWGLSLVYIEALSALVSAITIWYAIRWVGGSVTGQLASDTTGSSRDQGYGPKAVSDNSRTDPVERSYKTAPPDGTEIFVMA